MSAALSLADQGFPVHLIEKSGQLGGQLRHLHTPVNGKHPQDVLENLLQRIQDHPHISVNLNSQVLNTSGFKGNFSTSILSDNGGMDTIQHGVTILATGGQEYRGNEYGLGIDPRVITLQDLEIRLNEGTLVPGDEPIKSVVMIQCVGPAEDFCSRICCTAALKNARELKTVYPDLQIYILYKDIRVYGHYESLYKDVRELGVIFLRYDQESKPEVIIENDPDYSDTKTSNLQVNAWDNTLNRQVAFYPDLLVLSMPVIPQSDMKDLAKCFKVSLEFSDRTSLDRSSF